MKTRGKLVALFAVLVAVVALTVLYFSHHAVPVLQPAGEIGHKERGLMLFALIISAVIVVPVFTILGLFIWRYREGGRGTYDAKLESNNKVEAIWWILPTAIIAVIAVVTWRSSYALDPFKQIDSSKQTLHVQVVSLDWKWLFIYPQQGVASVNVAYVPVGTPVEFDLTSDTVMTSFWVPSLGGQMYAMPGMTTKLNLRADKLGQYKGVTANISGSGFADQTFTVAAIQPELYQQSINAMHASATKLNQASYTALAKPSVLKAGQVEYYGTVASDLYNTIVMKYMMPMPSGTAETESK